MNSRIPPFLILPLLLFYMTCNTGTPGKNNGAAPSNTTHATKNPENNTIQQSSSSRIVSASLPKGYPSLRHFKYNSDSLNYLLTFYELPDSSLDIYVSASWGIDSVFSYTGIAQPSPIDTKIIFTNNTTILATGQFRIYRNSSTFTLKLGKNQNGAVFASALCTDTSTAYQLSAPVLLPELSCPDPDSIAITNGRFLSLGLSINGPDSFFGLALFSYSVDTFNSSHGLLISILRNNNNELLEKRCFTQAGQITLCPYNSMVKSYMGSCKSELPFYDNQITADTINNWLMAYKNPLLPILPDGTNLYSIAFYDTVIKCYIESDLTRITVENGVWKATEIKMINQQPKPANGIYREQWRQGGRSFVEDDCRCDNLACIINGDDLLLGSYCDIPDGNDGDMTEHFKIENLYTRPDGVSVFTFGEHCAEFKETPQKELRILYNGEYKKFIHTENPRYSSEKTDCEDYQG